MIEAAATAEAAVDHQTHPRDRERALGDGAGEHYLARLAACLPHGRRLRSQRQATVQGGKFQLRPPASGLDRPLALEDFPLSGQKHQHGFACAAGFQPMLLKPAHHLLLQGLLRPRGLVRQLHREAFPFTADHCGLRQLAGQRGEIQRGRHHQQAQLRRQQWPGFQ